MLKQKNNSITYEETIKNNGTFRSAQPNGSRLPERNNCGTQHGDAANNECTLRPYKC